MADLSLADNRKTVTCKDGDELSLTISADRKTIKLKIRDQNFGTLAVLKVHICVDYVNYTTKVGELSFNTAADTFIDKWQAYFPDCR